MSTTNIFAILRRQRSTTRTRSPPDSDLNLKARGGPCNRPTFRTKFPSQLAAIQLEGSNERPRSLACFSSPFQVCEPRVACMRNAECDIAPASRRGLPTPSDEPEVCHARPGAAGRLGAVRPGPSPSHHHPSPLLYATSRRDRTARAGRAASGIIYAAGGQRRPEA